MASDLLADTRVVEAPNPIFRISGHIAWPLAALGILLILQLNSVLTRAVNWDEFFYYSQVEQFLRGELDRPLQTLHVRLFSWLVAMPGNGVDHIIAGRVVMFGAELVTLAAIAAIATHFTDRRTGVTCSLVYLSSIYVLQHGFSFRVDPLAACLCMAALWVLLKSRLEFVSLLLFGLLVALAGMVTIKAALYAPAFLGIAWLRISDDGRLYKTMLLRLCAGGVLALALFAALYFLHSSGIDRETSRGAGATVNSAAGYVIGSGLKAYPRFAIMQVYWSPMLVLALAFAPFAIARSDLRRNTKVALSGLLATVLVLLVYRNALPYFYAFILPPVICGACLVMDDAIKRYSLAAVSAVFCLSGAFIWSMEPSSTIERQRLILDVADEMFPEPVAYFDFCGMLGKFDKSNPFMTTWGMVSYLKAGKPVFVESMAKKVVPLVLASEQENYLTFEKMFTNPEASPYFHPDDAAALRANYVPFWGPFWLAGKTIEPLHDAVAEDFLVPGPYTVHGGAVFVDGMKYDEGAILQLDRGKHLLRAADNLQAQLVWGENIEKPSQAPPERPYWADF